MQYSVCDTCLENDATQCGVIQVLRCIIVWCQARSQTEARKPRL